MGLPRPLRACLGTLAAFAALSAWAAGAQAHVQVRPALAAPEDPVLWTVLVPNEKEVGTTAVELKVPPGVTPFSFLDLPGWKRTEKLAPNGALDTVKWTGRLASDGLAQFQFLATTPPEPGQISWRALQTYADGSVVRWIGGQGSEEPASITRIATDAPRENAGGEGAGSATPAAGGGESGSTEAGDVASADDQSTDWVGRGLALGALLVGGAALVLTLRSRPRRPRADRSPRGQKDAW